LCKYSTISPKYREVQSLLLRSVFVRPDLTRQLYLIIFIQRDYRRWFCKTVFARASPIPFPEANARSLAWIRTTGNYTGAGGTCDQVFAVRDGSRYCHTGELVGCRYNAGRRARGEPWRTAFVPRTSCNSKYIRRAIVADVRHVYPIISWSASLVSARHFNRLANLVPRRNRSPNKKNNRTTCRARVIVGRASCHPGRHEPVANVSECLAFARRWI